MSRAYAYTVSAVLLAAVLSPGLRDAQDPRNDSFPLSTYPMFSYDKPRTATVTSAVALGADGLEVPLAPEFIGTSETMQALRTIQNSVRAGRERAAELCGAIAERARRLNPENVIFARAHSDEEVAHLERLGVDHVVMGEREIARAILGLAAARRPAT